MHRPWLDTEWYAGAYLTSNETLNRWDPDHASLRIGWRQLLGDLQVNAQYRFTRYFDDEDRTEAISRNWIDLEALWDRWKGDSKRFEVGLKMTGDLDYEELEGAFQFTWYFHNDKSYRAFRPGDPDFRDVRARRATQTTIGPR